jgi:hypothetical protein
MQKDEDFTQRKFKRRQRQNYYQNERQHPMNVVELAIGENWTKFGATPLATVMGRLCVLSGLLKRKEGVTDANSHCATLPQGYWPRESQSFYATVVSIDGRIFSMANSNGIVSLCGVTIILDY